MDVSGDNLLKLIEKNPNSIEPLEKLARFYLTHTQYEEALKTYRRLVEMNPSNPEYYNDIGVLLYILKMIDQAEWMLRKSIDIGRGWQEAHLNLARLLSEKDDAFGAIEHYVKYLLNQPEDNILWEEFGLLLEKVDLNRILIVMEEGIGNMIMLTPTIRAIKSMHPQMKIHILGKYPALEVVEKWDFVEKVLIKPDGTRYAAVFYSMWSSVSRVHYSDFIDRCSVCHFMIDYNNPNLHEASCHLQIAKNLGFTEQMPLPFCSSEEIDINIPNDKPLIGICDTAMPLDQVVNWERKRWPHYQDLAKVFASKGYHIALFGGKTEADKFDPHVWPKETINFMGKYTLPQTAFLMKQCKAIVANDSGPAHMAAALGIPTFVLFGPTRISKNKPIGENVTVITKNLPCSPCQYSSQWQQCNDWRCMSNIHVDDVLSAMEASLNCNIRPKHNINNDFIKGTILIVGVLDVSSSTNVFMRKGFEKSGFQVDAYNYRTRARDLESYEAMWEDFKEFINGKEYDLIVFCKINGFHPDLITLANLHAPTWYWFMDNIDVAKSIHAKEYVKRAEFASATSEEVLAWFQDYNPKTYQMLEGFDSEVYFAEKLEKIHDVLFVGNATPKRIQGLKEIKEGFSVTVFGNDWPEEFNAKPAIYNDELRKAIGQSRVVLNLVHSNIFSDRVVLTAASGGFVLSQYCPDLERHFVRKQHLDWFENTAEARKLIHYYLSNETERENIAAQGAESVRNRFGWDAVCNKVVEIVESGEDSVFVKQNSAQNRDECEGDKCTFCDGKLIGPVVQDLLRCEGCGVYRKKHILPRETIREQLKSFMLGACIYKEKEISRFQDAAYQLNLLERYIQPGKVYDVGAAAGFFMKAAKDRGWSVYGNEISRSAIDWARQYYGLEIEYGFLEELNPLENNYNAVVLWNTLEHTFNAKETLEICRSMLRDKGLLMIQVPDKMDEEDLIKRYEALHTYEFNRNNLPRLLEQMGFEPLEVIPQDGNDNQHMTLIYRKRILNETEVISNYCDKTSERVMFVSWHGLGDNVMLTPALRKYKQKFPNKYIAVAGLKRFGETLKQLLSDLPFVDEVIPCLPDAWNDFDEYDTGVQAVVTEAKRIAEDKEYNDIVILPTRRQPGYKLHKIFRFADEMGIQFESLEDLQTELKVTKEAEKRVMKFIGDYKKPLLVLHTIAGNSSKTLAPEIVEKIVEQFPQHSIFEFGRQSNKRSIFVPEDDMEFSKALINVADQVIAIDSVVMHIAGAFCKPCIAIFTTTPVHQAIPVLSDNIVTIGFENEITELSKWPEYKKQINEIYPTKAQKTPRILTTSAKHSDVKQVNEKTNYLGCNAIPQDINEDNKLRMPENYYFPITYWAHMITFRCNGKCPFCILNGRGRHQSVKELRGEEILKFWNNLEHPPGQRLSLIGGEPTLHRDIVEIVNNLEGYDITITTNCKGPFYSDPNFYKKFSPQPSSTLRINTTFHPHFISAEEYIRIIRKYRQTGYFVDQTSYVYRPDIREFQKEIDKVSREIPVRAAPYLGFYDSQGKFEAPFYPNHIEPNENYHDLEAAARICGLTSINSYRDMCGQYEKRQVTCQHPMLSLIVGPEGNYYHCHYKLYYGIDPVCNIKNFVPVRKENFDCRHYGFCNWCDVPRVGSKKNTTAQKMVLNKLYDHREFNRSEIQSLMNDIAKFSNEHQLEFNPLKWFEYSYCILYSGHRHRGKVLDVGSAKSVFPYYLSSKGYDVTTIDIADSNYRNEKSKIFNISSITGDLRKAYHEFEGKFDLISNLSVIEHIYEDTQVVLNLAKYLKPGGIMVISTDFYERYIEYPDANREIVKDRPMGSHTDSRVYTSETFLERIVKPLEVVGVYRLGLTDYNNVEIKDLKERAVRGLYTFGIAILRKSI